MQVMFLLANHAASGAPRARAPVVFGHICEGGSGRARSRCQEVANALSPRNVWPQAAPGRGDGARSAGVKRARVFARALGGWGQPMVRLCAQPRPSTSSSHNPVACVWQRLGLARRRESERGSPGDHRRLEAALQECGLDADLRGSATTNFVWTENCYMRIYT